jgi:antitoxin CptB
MILTMISQQQKAKLIWNCRRGMLELDLILNNFINQRIDELNPEEFEAMEWLLTHSDPDLYSWLMGNERPEEREIAAIVDIIRHNHRN